MSKSLGIITSRSRLRCNATQAWQKICFYEHIVLRPSWLLRSVLPVPVKTTGQYRQVGDVSRCAYSDGGFLTKQISRIVPEESIEFDIIEQSIRYSGWIALQGGTIRVIADTAGTCMVQMTTRYELATGSFIFTRPFIGIVIKAMHGIVIRDMQYRLVGSSNPRAVHT